MKEIQMLSSISKKAKPMHFSLIVLLLCTVLVLSGCNKKVEVEEEVLEESALSVPYSIGPSSPPEVDFPTSNPPSNNE